MIATTELKKELSKSLALLQTLRDEVRLKVHLASMDAKDQWSKLDGQLTEVEQSAAKHASDASRVLLMDAVKKVDAFLASLG